MSGELLNQRLDSILGFLEESVRSGAAFVQEQTPEVVQQLLAWKFAESLALFVLATALMAFGVTMLVRFPQIRRDRIEAAKKDYEAGEAWTRYSGAASVASTEYDFVVATGGAYSFVLLALGGVSFILSFAFVNLTWLQIWIAPKVYLLEYASSFIK